jgi:hypothetical protein
MAHAAIVASHQRPLEKVCCGSGGRRGGQRYGCGSLRTLARAFRRLTKERRRPCWSPRSLARHVRHTASSRAISFASSAPDTTRTGSLRPGARCCNCCSWVNIEGCFTPRRPRLTAYAARKISSTLCPPDDDFTPKPLPERSMSNSTRPPSSACTCKTVPAVDVTKEDTEENRWLSPYRKSCCPACRCSSPRTDAPAMVGVAQLLPVRVTFSDAGSRGDGERSRGHPDRNSPDPRRRRRKSRPGSGRLSAAGRTPEQLTRLHGIEGIGEDAVGRLGAKPSIEGQRSPRGPVVSREILFQPGVSV